LIEQNILPKLVSPVGSRVLLCSQLKWNRFWNASVV